MGFFLRVFFMGLLPQNTVTMAILTVLCNRHRFRILASFFPYIVPCLTYETIDIIKCFILLNFIALSQYLHYSGIC
jgi:hypothetical protein